MNDSPFQVCAALSLAVHLGLAFGGVVLARAPSAPASAGAGSTAKEQGTAAALGGDTFEIQEETTPIEEAAEPESQPTPASPSPSQAQPIELDDGPSRAVAHAPPHPRAPAKSGRSGEAPSPPPVVQAVYGAVGDRAASDLVVTFKRAFPLAASSDPIWKQVPVGFYADGDVTFTLSEEGVLTHTTISANAAPAFRAAIARTVALIKARAFTARGAKTRLHMVLRVTDQLTNNGAFTIDAAGSFELPSGRHVSVAIVER